MTTKVRLKAEIKLLCSLLECQAKIIDKQRAELDSVKTLVLEALAI